MRGEGPDRAQGIAGGETVLGRPNRPEAVQATEVLVVPAESGPIRLVEYTDPISVWCWGCEPAIRRIEYRYAGAVDVSHVMGGLFEDFGPMKEYWSRMSGGKWKEPVLTFLTAVAAQHRMPMDVAGMMATMDDFRSTWPGCVAVKAADLVGPEAGRRYLRRLREAGLVEGRPIFRRDVQLAVAAQARVDVDRFSDALESGRADRAFQADLEECRGRNVQGFPTFEVRRGPANLRLEGYQSWESLEEALRALDGDLAARELAWDKPAVLDLLRHYGQCATREVAAVFGVTDDDVEIMLEDLLADGAVVRKDYGNASFWRPRAL